LTSSFAFIISYLDQIDTHPLLTMPSVPTTQTAIIASEAGDFELSSSVAVPEVGPREILIRTKAVALNPVDAKMIGDFVTPGCIYGFDCSGEVVAIGKDVRRTDLKIGDRVCGSGSGSKSLAQGIIGPTDSPQ
jgi:NADPH:quinone reductase-like Zn-dependent oxidoreductase